MVGNLAFCGAVLRCNIPDELAKLCQWARCLVAISDCAFHAIVHKSYSVVRACGVKYLVELELYHGCVWRPLVISGIECKEQWHNYIGRKKIHIYGLSTSVEYSENDLMSRTTE